MFTIYQSRPIRGQDWVSDNQWGPDNSQSTPGPFHHQGRGLFRFICHHPGDKLIRRAENLESFYWTRVLLKVFLHSFTDCEKINDKILFCQSTLAATFLRSSPIDLLGNQSEDCPCQCIDQSDPCFDIISIIVAGMCVTASGASL